MFRILLFLLCFSPVEDAFCQTYVFAELTGSPVINTTGWNLTGNAYAGDTPGDADAFSDELILTNAANSQSGGVFWNEAIDPGICTKWTVDFEYRIWGGSAADGIAFCFLDVPPAGFVSGGGVGIPGTSNGLKVILDTWNNCGGPNPELQIYNGVGYSECIAGIVKVDNSGGTLGFVRNSNYQPARITYDNGNIEFYINGTLYLSTFSLVTFSGYMGFTASTGGANDQHSVRNVIIYTDQAESDAGPDLETCSNQTISIGTADNPAFEYSWSPTTGLDDPSSSSPNLTLTNSSGTDLVQTYTVTTSLASNPGVCPTSDEVEITVHSTYDEELNISQCGGSYNFAGTNYTQSGVYNALLASANGCDSNVTLNLTIWNEPIINVSDKIICFGEIALLQAIGAESYLWQPSLPGDGTDGNFSVSPSTTTNYTVSGTDLNGCIGTATATVTVNQLPNVVGSASPNAICPGDSIFLQASGAVDYVWTGNSILLPNDESQTIYPNASETISLTGIDVNGCSNSDLITITVYGAPQVQINSVPNEICLGDEATLTASGANTYNWLGNNILDPNSATQQLSPTITDLYTVVGTSTDGCTDTANFQLIVHPLPILSITDPMNLCYGDTATIQVNGADAYLWSPLITNQDDQQLAIVSPESTTTYTVTGFDLFGCASEISTTITVLSLPEATFLMSPANLDIYQSTTTQLYNTSSNAVEYSWDFGDGSPFSSVEEPSHTYSTESIGNYDITLYAYNVLGCVDSITLSINVGSGLVYYIPNTFTPDGDAFNQNFQPVFLGGYDPYDFKMLIFNRWGEIIFETHNADLGWDGSYGGKLAQDGTYSYVIEYKLPNNDEKGFIRGHVNLVR